jgi:uncharacterized delta-60 repeat protein
MAGTLDLTFNKKGWNDLFSLGISSIINSTILDTNTGKYVSVGYIIMDSINKVLITRFNNDGSLDTTFNGTGYVIENFGYVKIVGKSIALDNNGKYVVTGYVEDEFNSSLFIARYDTNGKLDNSFNKTGYVIEEIDGTATLGYSIIVDNDGKYVVTGIANTGEIKDYSLLIIRYDTNGILDKSFNSIGYVIKNYNSARTLGYSIVVDTSGKYIVAGSNIYLDGSIRLLITRYNNNGSLDKSFNGTGYDDSYIIINESVTGPPTGMQLIIDNNKYVICSQDIPEGPIPGTFIIVKYNNSGTLDKTFNNSGYITQSFVSDLRTLSNSILLDNDGKYVVAGYTYIASDIINLVIARYNNNGTLDTSFNNGINYVIQTFPNTNTSVGNSIILDNGNYVVSGVIVLNNNPYGLISRFLSGYIPPTTTTTTTLPPYQYAIVRFSIDAVYSQIFESMSLDYYKDQLKQAIFYFCGAPINTITVLSVTPGSIVNEVQLPSQYVNALQKAFLCGLFAIVLLEQRYLGIPGSFVIVNNICFRKGTQILTPSGYKLIEDINNGDLLMTANGRTTTVNKVISFIGTEQHCPLYVLPKNCMGRNVPIVDLYMSEGHAFRHKGHWCHMKCSTLAIKLDTDKIEYYNIAVDNYITDTLVANGVEVESLFNLKDLSMTWKCKTDDCKPIITIKNV